MNGLPFMAPRTFRSVQALTIWGPDRHSTSFATTWMLEWTSVILSSSTQQVFNSRKDSHDIACQTVTYKMGYYTNTTPDRRAWQAGRQAGKQVGAKTVL